MNFCERREANGLPGSRPVHFNADSEAEFHD